MFTASVIKKVSALAERISVEPADLLAIAEVESAGTVSWNVGGKQLPAVRFEGHYFYKRLTGAKLKRAVNEGLAKPKAGAVPNPASYSARYALVERAAKIDRAAAYESCSWGLGQVMGAHWRKLGYASVQELVDGCATVDGQVEVMSRYVVKFGLVDELQRDDFLHFALGYNGPQARKWGYDKKIKAAHARWKKQLAGVLPPTDNAIAELQRDLSTLGFYNGPIDGREGVLTRKAITAFQAANGLNTDGHSGVLTREAITDALKQKAAGSADYSVKVGGQAAAGGAGGSVAVEGLDKIGDTLQTQGQTLQWMDVGIQALQWIAIGMTLLGTAILMYGLYKKFAVSKGE